MEPKRRSKRYFGRQSAKIGGTHKRKVKETKHKEKSLKEKKGKYYKRLRG